MLIKYKSLTWINIDWLMLLQNLLNLYSKVFKNKFLLLSREIGKHFYGLVRGLEVKNREYVVFVLF